MNNHQSDNTDNDIGSGNHLDHDDDTQYSSICTFLIEIQMTVIVKIGNTNRPKQTWVHMSRRKKYHGDHDHKVDHPAPALPSL